MKRLRIRRVKRVLLSILGLVLVTLAGLLSYSFAKSPFFDIKEINVTGNTTVSIDEIVALSGLKIGSNILQYSNARLEERITNQPFLRMVQVRRILPNRIDIKVVERIPMTVISAEEKYLILDEYGYCLSEVSPSTAESWSLPGIRCSPAAIDLKPGEQSVDKGVLAALTFMSKLDPFFLENVLEIDAPTAEKLAVINRDGLYVLFGQPEDLEKKLQKYEELLIKNAATCNADTLEYVDLRYDTQITLKWK